MFKKIVMAPFLLYVYNLIAMASGYVVPINVFNILFVGVLGIPGLITLVIYLIVGF